MKTADISLIINTFNNPYRLQQVLKGVERQSKLPGEVLVADDGSTEETAKVIGNWKQSQKISVHHVWQEHNGFRRSKILNKAIVRARGTYLVFLDGDSVPHKKFIQDHAKLAEEGYWVQGCRCFVMEDAIYDFTPTLPCVLKYILTRKIQGKRHAVRLVPSIEIDQDVKGTAGCNLGIWKRDLCLVNGYDEGYEGWGEEDADLIVRLINMGLRRKKVKSLTIAYHLNHPLCPRNDLEANKNRLACTITKESTKCEIGLDQYID
jgi:glycosyltransferase involved in cell wall biosynthesis